MSKDLIVAWFAMYLITAFLVYRNAVSPLMVRPTGWELAVLMSLPFTWWIVWVVAAGQLVQIMRRKL